MITNIRQLKRFLEEDLWRISEHDALSPSQKYLYNNLKKLVLAIQRFMRDRIVNRAAALTYTTLLATVPILAVVFAIARGFGFSKFVEHEMRESFRGHDTAIDTLLQAINSYITHTQSGIFLGIGFVMLIWTVLILTSNIENAFNLIWQVKKPRSPFRKFTDYFSILLLLPLLLVVISGFSIYMTTIVRNMPDFLLLGATARFLIRTIPYIFIGLAFVGLYIFMPNTHVQFRHAVIPGFLAGAAFQGLQYFYINSQIWISNYNAIYGSFAAIPMFLIWTQISWSICLFGAELCYANQNVDYYNFEYDIRHISRRTHDFLSLLLLSYICKRFENKQDKHYSAGELTRELKIPLRLTNNLLYELTELGWIIGELPQGDEKSTAVTYVPNCNMEHIRIADVLQSIHEAGNGSLIIDESNFGEQWKVYQEMEHTFSTLSTDKLLKDF